MPDEAITAPSTDTSFDAPAADTPTTDPAVGGQVADTQAPDATDPNVINMRADYTRKTQELAQQRQEFEAQQAEAAQREELFRAALLEQNEDAAQELLESLGYEFGDEVGEPADPETARLRSQIEELNQWKSQQEADAQARDNAIHIEREFLRLGQDGWDDANPAHNAILAFAFSHDDPANPGQTNVEAGFKDYEALRDHIISEYRQSKAAPTSDQFGSPASAAQPDNASLDQRGLAAIERNLFGAD